MRRALTGLAIALLACVSVLLWTFTPRRLPVSGEPLGELPGAHPPAGMTLSALPTGSMRSRAAFAYRGGSFTERRDFTMTAVLVHHPRGDLMIDTGYGRDFAAHARTLPWLMRALSTSTSTAPAADQLAAGGYELRRLAGVLLTHAHWDHVSGLPGLRGIPVWMNPEERRFVESGAPLAALMRSFGAADVREYAWEGGPYLGFSRSHDWYGDGSVVVVPAPGHTPGSVIVFVALPSGARYALVGDLVWQREGLDLPAERPWLSRLLVDEDPAEVRATISRMAAVHARFPDLVIVPAHDARAAAELPRFPATRG
jgi:glyoxylase-like metal-dependent hydrolase (beta-lactamase superfamily II)